MPVRRSAAATTPLGIWFGFGPAPTTWMPSVWPASRSARAAVRPASNSSGITEAIAQGFAGSALRSTLGPSSNPLGIVAHRVDMEASTIPSTPRSRMASIISFSSSGSPSVSAMMSR